MTQIRIPVESHPRDLPATCIVYLRPVVLNSYRDTSLKKICEICVICVICVICG